MKHLPNLLTLCNLFCGCLAVAYILSAQPYMSMSLENGTGLPTWMWVYGKEQILYGGMLIGLAALFDVLDGLTARALKIFSPIGKDLDSLADVVSFGVAPSAILFKFLWDAQAGETNAFDVSMLSLAPAFLIACFAALRLAKFNVTSETQKNYFIGMPTPAVGLFVASFPLIMWYTRGTLHHYFAMAFQHKWVLYGIIALVCWLMVSNVKFFKMLPAKWNMQYAWPHLVMLVCTSLSAFFLALGAIPVAFILYVILSMIYRQPETELNTKEQL